MSVSEELNQGLPSSSRLRSGLRCLRENVAAYLALMRRKPRPLVTTRQARLRLAIGTLTAIVLTGCVMLLVDAWSIGASQRLPYWLISVVDQATDFGRLTWILVPTGGLLVLFAFLASPALPRMSRGVLSATAVRLSFLFTATALPGLAVTIVKRLIGRGRPLVGGSADPFLYLPLGWKVEYASLPSGHATNAFAAAVAIGALWPRTRPLMWAYAVVIALSRVALTAHFPSDVLAGAFLGIAGALLVRRWFAARRLAFLQHSDGIVRPLPGPSFSRLTRVARQLLA
jgi:membrane-associated phospholipid phosphatase